jgi:hypothetical protein
VTAPDDKPGPPPRDRLPPGVQLSAEVRSRGPSGLVTHQLRIVGDDQRGYLLAGLSCVAGDDDDAEFWFATLEEAKRAAVRYGADELGWQPLDSLMQVRTS